MRSIHSRLDRLTRVTFDDRDPFTWVIVRDLDGVRWLADRVPRIWACRRGQDQNPPPRFIPVPEVLDCPAGRRLVVEEIDAGAPLDDLRIVYLDHDISGDGPGYEIFDEIGPDTRWDQVSTDDDWN